MRVTRIAASALSLALTLSTGACVAQAQFASNQPGTYGYAPAHGYGQDRDDRVRHDEQDGWDAAPRGYSDIQLRGYREGMDGARKDFGNRRRPNPNNRENYRHPHDVPHSLDGDYRAAFREGYRRAMEHLQGRDGYRQ